MNIIRDVKNLSVDEIEKLREIPNNKFQLSEQVMHATYQENNIEKLRYLKQHFGLTLPNNGNYHIDWSTENGDFYMVEFLVKECYCQPSTYAKQMAMVNEHVSLFDWLTQNVLNRTDMEYTYYDKETGLAIRIG